MLTKVLIATVWNGETGRAEQSVLKMVTTRPQAKGHSLVLRHSDQHTYTH
jgi:hypothetical protein